ncbi:MAG: hypothetical protein R6X29_04325 [Acidimicrobiia bacterium]|jgi:hypothetical protein
MAEMRELTPLAAEKVERLPGFGKPREYSVDFDKQAIRAADLRKRRNQVMAAVPAPTGPQPRARAIKGVLPTTSEVAKLRAVHESPAAAAELVAQRLDADGALGVTYSALVAVEFNRMKGEYQKRLRSTRDRRRVEAQWQKVVEAGIQAMDKAGVKGLSGQDLDRVVTELTRNKANFNAVVEIANSAKDEVIASTESILSPKGNLVTVYEFFKDPWDLVLPTVPDLCERPIEGKYTKHFSRSFNLSVRLTVWCPTWTNPFRTCQKTYTLAGVSFSIGLEVGYRITCCGAVAWGQAYAQACGTILGVTVCASCSAKIIGVTGVGKTGSGSTCQYGLGVTAELKCTFAGVTVFQANVPFGWTITGPCPPDSLPC